MEDIIIITETEVMEAIMVIGIIVGIIIGTHHTFHICIHT